MKFPKLSLTADSGVIKTIDAYSFGLRLLHSTHSIPACMHRLFKSSRNETNGTTTTVTPVEHAAGNINNKLLPPPVPMIPTTGLFCIMIAFNAGSWIPLNRPCSPTNSRNCCSMSTSRNCLHLLNCSSTASRAICRIAGLRPDDDGGDDGDGAMADRNNKNRCHAWLTFRNPALLLAVWDGDSVNCRA
jgi:hypothetical protein